MIDEHMIILDDVYFILTSFFGLDLQSHSSFFVKLEKIIMYKFYSIL